jgi:hypothetical protein
MPTPQELLIYILVAAPAITRTQPCGDDESVMVFLFLARSRLVAVEAVHAFPGVLAHFIFMNHGILQTCMTLRALSGGAHQVCAGLTGF